MQARFSLICFFFFIVCTGQAQVVIPAGAQNHVSGTIHVADSFVNDGVLEMGDSAHFHFSGNSWWEGRLRNTRGRGTVYLQGNKLQTLFNALQLYKVIVDNNSGVKAASLAIDSLLQLNTGMLQSGNLEMQHNSWMVRTGGSLYQAPKAQGTFNLLYPVYTPLAAGPELVNSGLNNLVIENIQGVSVRNDVSVAGSVTGIGTLIFNGAQQQKLSSGNGFSIGQLFVQNTAGLRLGASGTVQNVLRLDAGKLFLGTQTLTLPADADIAAYSASNYIIAGTDAARLMRTGFTGSLLYPVGTAEEYLPVTVTHTAAADFALGLFKGLTANAAADDTVAANKKGMVDVVWIAEGNPLGAVLDLHWTNNLEGADFAKAADGQIGVFAHKGAWKLAGLPLASSNRANTVRFTASSNSRFAVGLRDTTALSLKVTLQGRKLFDKDGVTLNWQLNKPALMKGRMVLEHSLNGTDFAPVYEMATVGLPMYNYVHLTAAKGLNYYRIICYCASGVAVQSNTVVITYTEGFEKIEAFPNPTTGPVTVRFTTNTAAADRMMLYTAAGQLVQQSKLELAAGVNDIHLNLDKLAGGVYIIKLRNSVVRVEKVD